VLVRNLPEDHNRWQVKQTNNEKRSQQNREASKARHGNKKASSSSYQNLSLELEEDLKVIVVTD